MTELINKIKEIICKVNNTIEGNSDKSTKYICITKHDASKLSDISEKYSIDFKANYKGKSLKIYTSL